MNNQITDYLKTIGKRGGDKTKERGTEHFKAIGRAGALKRWGVKMKSKNSTEQVSEKAKPEANLTQKRGESDANLG